MNKKHCMIFHNIMYVLRNTWNWERTIIIFLILQAIIGVIMPFISIYMPSTILRGVTGELPLNKLVPLVIILALVMALCTIINAYIQAVNETHLTNNKIHYLTSIFKKKMTLDYKIIESEYGQNKFQDVLNILFNDNAGVSGMLQTLGVVSGKIMGITLYSGIIAMLTPKLVITLLITSLIYMLVLRYVNAYEYKHREQWIPIDKKISYMFEKTADYAYSKDIKLYSMKNWFVSLIDSLISKRMEWLKKISCHNFIIVIADVLLLISREGLAYSYIFYAIFSGKIQIAEFALYFGAITGFSGFITEIVQGLVSIMRTSNDVNTIREYLDIKTIHSGNQNIELNKEDTFEIEFRNVSFRYSEDSHDILKNINITIHKGEKVALVGENGAGKTTLVKLLCGFYQPTSGEIYINGIAMSDLKLETIYSLYSVVFQSVYVLPMTLAQNIALEEGVNIDMERVYYCLRLSGLDKDFTDLNIPLTKMIDENGVNLSGGEIQKLILARALYKQSHALILDEPTAALDPIAEAQLYGVYHKLTESKTSLFISHRLASTQFCDRILLLDHGIILEDGTHQELLKRGGKYYDLYKIQSQYYQSGEAEEMYAN